MDEAQFLQLVDQHQKVLHKICGLYRDSKEDREDLFQEIVFQLWKSVPSFEGKSKFSTWMYRIALSTAIAVFRKQKPDIVYTPVLPDRQESLEEHQEHVEQLYQSLRKLNDADKALIALYLEGLTYQEISEITGFTESNIGVRLNRIKKKIQQHLNIK